MTVALWAAALALETSCRVVGSGEPPGRAIVGRSARSSAIAATPPATGPSGAPERAREQPRDIAAAQTDAADPRTDAKPAVATPGTSLVRSIDAAVHGAIARHEVPGAVVVVAQGNGVLFRRAYGAQALAPSVEPMREETLFDLASLTKPMVTATLVMQLVEQGRLARSDPLSLRLPEAAGQPTAPLTVEQLLHHRSTLPAANALSDFAGGRDEAVRRMLALAPTARPGSRRLYSDVGYLLLGVLVERVAGRPLEELARQRIFEPIGAGCTFRPDPALRDRIAPTAPSEGGWLRGVVHDPRARAFGQVAGHAGLFGTADDVARFARMILRRGELDGVRVLSAESVAALTALEQAAAAPGTRTSKAATTDPRPHALLGGAVAGGLGHSGFTGSYLWIDPAHDIALAVLASRLHPDGKGSADRLRRELVAALGTAIERDAAVVVDAARAVPAPAPSAARVETGIDRLVAQSFAPLAGRKLALLTHQSGRSRDGRRTIDLLAAAPGVELVRLFSPEHGLDSAAEGEVASGRDRTTGLPVVSLYGRHRRPLPADLAGIDTIVVDLQHVGTRFYTYETTLGYLLESAAAAHKRVVVLERPNPLGGVVVEGPVLDRGRESFVGSHPLPIRHGLTMGELATMIRAERTLDVALEIIPMRGWRREQLFADTGLAWVAPSPNLPTPEAALLYPGIGLLETTNLSVGRGTERPFSLVGAPWLDAQSLADALGRAGLAGVRFEPTDFTPSASSFAGQPCHGIAIVVTDPRTLRPVRVGLQIAVALQARHARSWRPIGLDVLLGDAATLAAISQGKSAAVIEQGWQRELAEFAERRASYLIY